MSPPQSEIIYSFTCEILTYKVLTNKILTCKVLTCNAVPINGFISECHYGRASLLATSVVRYPLTSLHATSVVCYPLIYLQAKFLRANIFARYLVCARVLSLLVIYTIRLPYAGAISTAESETLFNLN